MSTNRTRKYGKDSKIIVVGAGVFGLSNALNLAQNGYKNICVYDRLDMDANHYTFLEGADTASGDINKIFRAEYGDKVHYQNLAFEAFEIWQKWNRDISQVPPEEGKKYKDLCLLDMCSMLRLDDRLSNEELANRKNFAKLGLRPLIHDINDSVDVRRARASGLGSKIQFALDLKEKIPSLHGSLDSSSGMLYASRCCLYAKYLCTQLGVKFVLGGKKGTLKKYLTDETGTIVKGIVTEDGLSHAADLVVISLGPWSTSLVPELDGINEAASGNILLFKIPEHRKDLIEKYKSKNFPLIGWKPGHEREKDHLGGMYMFPIMEPEGYMKIIVRQTKYTNHVTLKDGRNVSIPKTAITRPAQTSLTKHIVSQAKEWMELFFSDLVEAGVKLESKILWYTDTVNNDYIYDFVPGKQNLFVACGGSGHAFKMLPVLGRFLVDKLEGRENFYTNLFKWRDPKDFPRDPNGLKEGRNGPRVYSKQEIAQATDYIFASLSKL
jgi:sarcosine oxidase / L-pipecolate oxidase